MFCICCSCFPQITVINLSSVVLCRCLFLPSLAPHNAPTNNTNASGVSDGAVLSGMGTGKNSLALLSVFDKTKAMILCRPMMIPLK